jgi:hypothetical protein
MAQGTIVYGPITDVDLAVGVGGFNNPSPGGGTIVGKRINLETFAFLGQSDWAPAAIAPNEWASVAVSVIGARVGFPAIVTFDGILGHQNRVLWARCENQDQVLVILNNNHASSALTVGPGTVRVWCFPVPLV